MTRYLPNLSTLILPKDLPENLGFIQNAVESIFDDVYFDNYQVLEEAKGSEKTYNLDIIIDKPFGFDNILGSGLSLLVNPSESQTETVIPVSLFYRWGILRFINNFDASKFSFSKEDLVNLMLKICGIDQETLLKYISIRIKNPRGGALGYIIYNEEELVDFFNAYYELTGTSNELAYTNNTTFESIRLGLASAGITAEDVINDFGISTDYPSGDDTIEDVYSRLNVERDGGTLSISELIDRLNEDYSLLNTSNEIIYVDDPETTYEDILSALDVAEITLLNLIVDYILFDATSLNDIKDTLIDFFVEAKEDSYGTEFYDLFKPQIGFSVNDINLALAFPRTWLKPIDQNTGQVDTDENKKSMLRFNVGALHYSTENGLEFENESSFTFEKSQIGNTGMTIEFSNMKLDLSRTKNIPEATAAGYPDDFMGVFVESAKIGLPEKWFKNIASNSATLGIFGENLLLGTGGISGKFGLRAIDTITNTPISGSTPSNAEMEFKLGGDNGLIIGFKHFDFTLRQGEFVSTNIAGSLTIPGFKNESGNNNAKIDISMSFAKDGNFYIAASKTDGIIPPIKILDVLELTIKSLSVGKEDGKFYISTSGSMKFIGSGLVSQLFQDPLEIDQLIIWQDGTIELKGLDGAFKLPKPKTMKLGPADITVTAVHFGTDERMHNNVMRKYWYFGFDGGVSINPGGIDARGDGVKIYFTVDNTDGRTLHTFFRIQSLAIDLIIPGSASRESAAVIINGYLSMKEPTGDTEGTEYIGGISLDLPKLRISASAAMRYNPSIPSYLVDVNLNLPSAIPLGPTGVGIYGFRGLLGQRYIASRQAVGLSDNSSWYEYYKKKVAPDYKEGIQVSKFAQQNGFSVGAGVSLATAFDGGKVFSSKVFVMLSLPEVLLIQGQGAILRERIGLDTTNDPPFSAMIAISSQSVEAAFGANIQIPEGGGEIAKVTGTAEMAFFFNNSGAWYLNIGRNKPEDKRVRAEIFTLFNAYFYFMLSKKGIETGAGANWDFNKKLGPLSISAFAYIDVTGKVGFKPVQMGGSIGLGAGASIGVWKIKLGIEVHAYLAAEAPKPFIITGKFSFKLKLPWPIKKLGGPYSLEFTWSFNKTRDLSQILLIDPHNNVKAINRLTGESFAVCYSANEPNNFDSYIIPIDSFIDIEFLKGMKPMGGAITKFGDIGHGAEFTESVPPQPGKSKQVIHEFHLEDIKIWYKSSSGWAEYNMYEAIRPNPLYPDSIISFPNTSDTNKFKYGFWQCETPNKYNKLRVLSKSPLSYLTTFTSGLPSYPEDFGYKEGFLFCEGQRKPKTCVTFPEVDKIFAQGLFREQQRVLICATGDKGVVRPSANPFNLANALTFDKKVELRFHESKVLIDLRLASYADMVKVKYYRKQHIAEDSLLLEYVEITEKTFTPSASVKFDMISYKHTDYNNSGVDMITIESIGAANNNFLLNEYTTSLQLPEYILQQNEGKLLLEGSKTNNTQLFSICMMNLMDYNFNLYVKNQAEITEGSLAMRENFINVTDPIWRPDTIYKIEIKTKDDLIGEKSYENSYSFFFKTAGPLGHFHNKYKENNAILYETLAAKGREDEFRLATLKPYIDYSRSYPNADGRLINAKPLFYKAPKLLMFYKQNTVHAMYNSFENYGNNGVITSELRVLIKDPAEPVATNIDDYTATVSWKKNPDPMITPEVRMLNNLAINVENNCSGFEEFTPLSVVQEIETRTLRPDALYTAVFNAVFKGDTNQVHSYVFKTSQYEDFEEQIQSYILRNENGEEKKAIFTVEKTFDTTTLNNASALLNGNYNGLMTEYANVFDRLTDGILKLGILPPAVTTDFNIIKNSNTGNIIGIIVRNPEPFNDPKIPESDLSDTIQLSVKIANGSSTSNYIVIFSQDKTQAFISNTTLNIPSGEATFTFRYKQYGIDETAKKNHYKTEAVETVKIGV